MWSSERRRTFISRLAKLLFGAFFAMSIVSAFKLKQGAPERVVPLELRPVKVASLAEIKQRGYVALSVGGTPVLVFPVGEELRAYDATCPHMGCPVSGRRLLEEGVLECPCHASTFDPATGARLSGPAPRGLRQLPLEVRNGQVYVLPA